ncbi:hypothetical protein MKX01_006108 [Papaver californicum]|nr:hypothetical protein MKX01_006108 [Papaver californicum]
MRLNSNPRLIMLLCSSVMLSFSVITSSATSTEAYPSDTYKSWSSDGEAEITMELVPPRRGVHGGGRIIDIRHTFRSIMPKWGSSEGLGQFLTIRNSMKMLPIHTGTHVDAPGHVFDHYFYASFDVDTLDLEVLNGVRRVLFRTLNTDRKLMLKNEFDTSYVGFMRDGAKWLVENTNIKLVGVDYLSVAAYDGMIPSHLVFLEDGIRKPFLDYKTAGMYNMHCLPLRLFGAEGSPVRCILIK